MDHTLFVQMLLVLIRDVTADEKMLWFDSKYIIWEVLIQGISELRMNGNSILRYSIIGI